MRVGLENDWEVQPPIRQMWRIIENAMREPIEWVPAEMWKGNGSSTYGIASVMQALADGTLDSYEDMLTINNERMQVSFCLRL